MGRIVLGTLVLGAGVALAGCGGDDAGGSPATTSSAVEGKPQATADAPLRANGMERRVRAHLKENFGGAYGPGSETSWYGYIEDVQVDFETIKVETSLYPDADARGPARAICSAALSTIPTLPEPMAGAQVLDRDGEALAECEPNG